MTAYRIAPVGRRGAAEWGHGRRVEVRSYVDLLRENEQLRAELETAREAWRNAHNQRIQAETRSVKAFRVLASVGRINPFLAAIVERGRVEVYGELP